MKREKAINNLFRKNGISYSLTFIRLNYEAEQYEYEVSLMRKERSFSFPFRTGIGWNKILKNPKEGLKHFPFACRTRDMIEQLCINPMRFHTMKDSSAKREILHPKFRIEPSIVDFVFSIMMDYCTWKDIIDFEDFCDSFGMDSDSRKTLNIYLQVEKEVGKVYRFFSEKEINILTKLTENY